MDWVWCLADASATALDVLGIELLELVPHLLHNGLHDLRRQDFNVALEHLRVLLLGHLLSRRRELSEKGWLRFRRKVRVLERKTTVLAGTYLPPPPPAS